MDVPILVCGCGMRVKAARGEARVAWAAARPAGDGSRSRRRRRSPRSRSRRSTSPTLGRRFRSASRDRAHPSPGPCRSPQRKRSPRPLRAAWRPPADGRRVVALAAEARDGVAHQLPLSAPRCGEPGDGRSLRRHRLDLHHCWSPSTASRPWRTPQSMGASLIGLLFTWIAAVPGRVPRSALRCLYWLQYLGRVLVDERDGRLRTCRGCPTATSTASSTG